MIFSPVIPQAFCHSGLRAGIAFETLKAIPDVLGMTGWTRFPQWINRIFNVIIDLIGSGMTA
jgi:hypothetical protein